MSSVFKHPVYSFREGWDSRNIGSLPGARGRSSRPQGPSKDLYPAPSSSKTPARPRGRGTAHPSRKGYHPVILLFAAFLPVGSALGTSAGAVPNEVRTVSEMKRSIDVIVLTGADLPTLLGRPVGTLRVVALKQGRLAPIPFQIDERDEQGSYVFRTSHPGPRRAGQGNLDANDELCFMVRDMGDRLHEPVIAEKGLLAEIQVEDPVDGARAWCYVGTDAVFPQLSPVNYVTYDPEDDRVLSRYYRLGFSREAPISYGDTSITQEGGGNDSRIHERIVTRLEGRFKLLGVHLRKSEADFRSIRRGYIDGPVRVIKRVGNSMRQVFGIYGPEAVVDYTFYLANWIMPTDIHLPVDMGRFCSELSLRGGTHWTREAEGMVFYSKYIAPGEAVIDGRTSDQEKRMDLRLDVDDTWHLYTGVPNNTGQGSLLFRILMDETLRQHLTATTFYYDRADEEDFQEDPVTRHLYETYFEGAYLWTGMETLSKGLYNITSWATVMPDYQTPGDERRYLDVLDRPLQATVRPLHTSPGPDPASGTES